MKLFEILRAKKSPILNSKEHSNKDSTLRKEESNKC